MAGKEYLYGHGYFTFPASLYGFPDKANAFYSNMLIGLKEPELTRTVMPGFRLLFSASPINNRMIVWQSECQVLKPGRRHGNEYDAAEDDSHVFKNYYEPAVFQVQRRLFPRPEMLDHSQVVLK